MSLAKLAKPKAWSAKGAKFKTSCALRGSVRDGLFGSGFFVAAPAGRGGSGPARSASAPTAGRRKHQIIGLTPFPIATSTRWPTGSESVGPGVDRAGFEPQRTQRFTEESMSLAKLAKPKAWSAKGAKFKTSCALRGSVRDGLFGSGFAVGPGVDRAVPVAASGGRGSSDPARSASAPTSRCRNHQIIGLTPWPIATLARWPTGSESVGPGVDRAGFEPTDHRPLCGFKPMTVGSDPYNPGSIRGEMVLDRIEQPNIQLRISRIVRIRIMDRLWGMAEGASPQRA